MPLTGTEPVKGRLAIATRGVAAIATLPALLDDHELVFGRGRASRPADAVLAWGRKPSAAVAQRLPCVMACRCCRSKTASCARSDSATTARRCRSCSTTSASTTTPVPPSRLEALVGLPREARALARAAALMAAVARRCASPSTTRRAMPPRRSPARTCSSSTRRAATPRSRTGWPTQRAFARMLDAALDEHPALPVLLKVHPDVIAGRKQGHYAALTPAQAARVHVCASPMHPAGLLEAAQAVYAVTSQLGFEALLWGASGAHVRHAVLCRLGADAGRARGARASPRRDAALEALVHAALVDYAALPRPGDRAALRGGAAHGLDRPAAAHAPAPAAAGLGGRLFALEEADRSALPGRQRRALRAFDDGGAGRRQHGRLGLPRRGAHALEPGHGTGCRAAPGRRLPALGRARRRSGAAALLGRRCDRPLLRRDPAERPRTAAR